MVAWIKSGVANLRMEFFWDPNCVGWLPKDGLREAPFHTEIYNQFLKTAQYLEMLPFMDPLSENSDDTLKNFFIFISSYKAEKPLSGFVIHRIYWVSPEKLSAEKILQGVSQHLYHVHESFLACCLLIHFMYYEKSTIFVYNCILPIVHETNKCSVNETCRVKYRCLIYFWTCQ